MTLRKLIELGKFLNPSYLDQEVKILFEEYEYGYLKDRYFRSIKSIDIVKSRPIIKVDSLSC